MNIKKLFLIFLLFPIFVFLKASPQSIEKESFGIQILQAYKDFNVQVETEKENLHLLMNQVHEIIASIEIHKEKLNQMIENAGEKLKTEYSFKTTQEK